MAIDLNTLSKLNGYLEERVQQIEEDAVTLDKLQTDARFLGDLRKFAEQITDFLEKNQNL